jgi:Flp pilus assembly protein TadD
MSNGQPSQGPGIDSPYTSPNTVIAAFDDISCEVPVPQVPPHVAKAKHLRDRARSLFDRDLYGEAIAALDEAIRLNPQDAHAFLLRGNAYALKRDHARAEADWAVAARLDPGLAK